MMTVTAEQAALSVILRSQMVILKRMAAYIDPDVHLNDLGEVRCTRYKCEVMAV